MKSLNLPVLKVKQPIGEFYIASISARKLVEISYSDVRRLAEEQRDLEKYLGIQRPVSKKRITQLKKYIQNRDATFPTAVILAVDGRCAEFDEEKSCLILSEYTPSDDEDDGKAIPYETIAKVIDGQHRIAAFMDESENWSFEFGEEDFDINVSVFVGADVSEQANIFATVNLAQTKVNRSLVYDLTELAKTRSPYKTCHNAAVTLDGIESSPFYKRIKRLGTATPGRAKEPLTQASFVESLVKCISVDADKDRNDLLEGRELEIGDLNKCPLRRLFVEGKDVDIIEIVYNYFCAVRKKWPASWDAIETTGNLLPRSNAFKALMKYFKEDVYLSAVGGVENAGGIPSVEKFYSYFEDLECPDSAFTTRNFAPGSGGQSTFLKLLRRQISFEEMFE